MRMPLILVLEHRELVKLIHLVIRKHGLILGLFVNILSLKLTLFEGVIRDLTLLVDSNGVVVRPDCERFRIALVKLADSVDGASLSVAFKGCDAVKILWLHLSVRIRNCLEVPDFDHTVSTTRKEIGLGRVSRQGINLVVMSGHNGAHILETFAGQVIASEVLIS